MYYDLTVTQFAKMLRNLSACLDKAEAYAAAKKFESTVLMNARLAPDQFPFIRQVQIACDTAKIGATRLTGKQCPTHADTEQTIPELKARIESTIGWLETLKPSDYVEADKRAVSQPRWEGKTLSGEQFAIQHMIPNFHFHVTTAYSILRHNGVDLGKKDFLGPMPFKSAA
jgi:hypothetical protein